jgi:hypothetical protein
VTPVGAGLVAPAGNRPATGHGLVRGSDRRSARGHIRGPVRWPAGWPVRWHVRWLLVVLLVAGVAAMHGAAGPAAPCMAGMTAASAAAPGIAHHRAPPSHHTPPQHGVETAGAHCQATLAAAGELAVPVAPGVPVSHRDAGRASVDGSRPARDARRSLAELQVLRL